MVSWQIFMSLHPKLLDIDHPLTFEQSKLRQIEAHALIYLRVGRTDETCSIYRRTRNSGNFD